jgi:hypothetical protein
MPSRKHIFAAALVIAALKTAGCGEARQGNLGVAARGNLDGEVFIVTEGAANVKLGLVEVRVLPNDDTKSSVANTKLQADRELAKLLPSWAAAQKRMLEAQSRTSAAIRETEAANDALDPAFDREDAAYSAFKSAAGVFKPIDRQVRGWESGALYFANLPPPISTVKTDSDGKFSITLDRNTPVVLAAYATRRVVNKTDNYYWLISVSLGGQASKRIFLSNDNLATADSKDSLIHVVE